MILILGGGGQLGLEIERLAIARAVALTALTRASLDICDRPAIDAAISRFNPSLVVNAAAYTNVDKAESEPALAHHVNAEGAGILAEACARSDIPLIHVSTDYVFDGMKPTAYVEDDPVEPLGVYGASKLAGERLVRQHAERHVIIRTSWLYGEFGHNFLKTILRLARERDELRIVADQQGCPTCTRDLASAILHLAPRVTSTDAPWGTYHFAGEGITTWFDFASHIVSVQAPITNREPKVTAITTADFPTAARRPINSALNCEKFQRQFDYQPRQWTLDATDVVLSLLQQSNRSKQ
jgi:dTDP-4-dehydrorhamnose reductase